MAAKDESATTVRDGPTSQRGEGPMDEPAQSTETPPPEPQQQRRRLWRWLAAVSGALLGGEPGTIYDADRQDRDEG